MCWKVPKIRTAQSAVGRIGVDRQNHREPGGAGASLLNSERVVGLQRHRGGVLIEADANDEFAWRLSPGNQEQQRREERAHPRML